jgi:hypothetical protein
MWECGCVCINLARPELRALLRLSEPHPGFLMNTLTVRNFTDY